MSRCAEPFRRQTSASRRTASLSSAFASVCSSGRTSLTGPGVAAREQLERDERRAAAGGALVLEPASQQLELLAEAELADRPVGDRALAVVRVPGGGLELVRPLRAQVGELALGAALAGEGVGGGGGLGQVQAGWSERGAGPT